MAELREIKKDEFGPEYVIQAYDAKIGMEGFLVIDNTVLGPGKGGIRLTSGVSSGEVWHLARTMTWKNAIAGIPFGGAKAGIVWPGGDLKLKKLFIQSFARAIKPFLPHKYIAGPDVNTGEQEMQWFVEATGDWQTATGKPANLCMKAFGKKGEKCGIPHEFGSTGFGVAKATLIAAGIAGLNIKRATIAIHGFGNVGTFAYRYLTESGAKVVALADRKGSIYSPSGFDQKILDEFAREKRSLMEYPNVKKLTSEAFWSVPADILIPASVTDVIHEGNKHQIKAKVIVEGGNIPMSDKIEKELWQKGILIVPDFVANAGGVISSYAEYRGYNPKYMFRIVEEKISDATRAVLKEAKKTGKNPREVGIAMARKKVEAGMKKKKSMF